MGLPVSEDVELPGQRGQGQGGQMDRFQVPPKEGGGGGIM